MGTQVEPSVKAACLLSSLRRASRAVTQLYDLVLAPVKLKATQLFILKEINRSGELAQHEFAERYGVAVETLSRRFCVLRRKGLLVCRSGPRKEQIYSLTPQGKETLAQAMRYWELAEFRLRTSLGESDWERLHVLALRSAAAAKEAERLRTTNQLRRAA